MDGFLAAKVTGPEGVNDEQQCENRLAVFEESVERPDDEERQHRRVDEGHVGGNVLGDAVIDEQCHRDDEEGQKAEAEQRSDDSNI